jgi:Trk K+ transport system NAD-binding subunit
MFAVFFALVSDWVFARRLDVVLGRVPTRWTNHVVLIGAGHMSVRLARVLHERGQRTLVIEHDADNALIPVLRAGSHQVLVGDATKDQTLRLAGADRARTILVMTSEDARNLHIALIARSVSRDARIWARIDSPPLSAHITQHSSIRASSPLLMAARAFAKEALYRAGA